MKQNEVWVLTTINDTETIGEKAIVSLHSSRESAIHEMRTDIKERVSINLLYERDVLWYPDENYAVTRDNTYAWLIEQKRVV